MARDFRFQLGTFVFIVALAISWFVSPPAAATPQSRKELTRAEVLELLEAGVPPKRVEILARERGVAFDMTAEAEQVLRRAGATPSLIETLRELVRTTPGPAVLMVESHPGGAQVFADDELIARTSSDGRLKVSTLAAGQHHVRVSLEGFPDFEDKVSLQAGKTSTVVATLDAPRAAAPAVLQIESKPGGAGVYVDDEFIARTSSEGRLKVSTLSPGRHRLRISADKYSDYEKNIELTAGRTLTVSATLELPSRKAGTVGTGKRDGQKYVWITPGSFTMGCSPDDTSCWDNEKPAHSVSLSKGFWIGQTEVTVDAYRRFTTATGKEMPGEPVVGGKKQNDGWKFGTYPMVAVNWDEAVAYCKWAGGRLPTEAEWEYAARAGNTTARYGPIGDVAWYADNSGPNPIDSAKIGREAGNNYEERIAGFGNTNHAVGQKQANAFGLFDTIGGVWEWVNDWYDEKYFATSPENDPQGPAKAEKRVEKGGSWLSTPGVVRASRRASLDPTVRWTDVGLRCALDQSQ